MAPLKQAMHRECLDVSDHIVNHGLLDRFQFHPGSLDDSHDEHHPWEYSCYLQRQPSQRKTSSFTDSPRFLHCSAPIHIFNLRKHTIILLVIDPRDTISDHDALTMFGGVRASTRVKTPTLKAKEGISWEFNPRRVV